MPDPKQPYQSKIIIIAVLTIIAGGLTALSTTQGVELNETALLFITTVVLPVVNIILRYFSNQPIQK